MAGKSAGAVLTVVNYQPDTVGNLTISKTVDGNAGDTGKDFNFTIQLTGPNVDGTYNYIGSGNKENGQLTITGGLGTITLKHNESITITGLPKDTAYVVTEDDYAVDGYLTGSTGASGTIKTNEGQTAAFTNTKYLPGSLTIKKTVAGNSGETGPFEFTVNFKKPDGTPDNNIYDFTGTGGAQNGTIESGGNISLSSVQSVTITGLPMDTIYTVTEKDYSASGYSTVSTGSSGTIRTDEEQTVSFVNTKIMPGTLTISKTVAGNGADTKKKFDFTVTFHSNGTYPYTGKGVPDGTIRSGDKISLADGEGITITGLPDGTEYQVTEASYSSERYTTAKTGDTGTVRTLETSTAAFTNTYRRPTSGGGGGGNPKVPTAPTTPTTPTAPAAPAPVTPTVNVDGSTPTGNMEGRAPDELVDINGGVPTGTRYGKNGLPKTGDKQSGDIIIYGLLCISALLGMAASASILRRKYSDK